MAEPEIEDPVAAFQESAAALAVGAFAKRGYSEADVERYLLAAGVSMMVLCQSAALPQTKEVRLIRGKTEKTQALVYQFSLASVNARGACPIMAINNYVAGVVGEPAKDEAFDAKKGDGDPVAEFRQIGQEFARHQHIADELALHFILRLALAATTLYVCLEDGQVNGFTFRREKSSLVGGTDGYVLKVGSRDAPRAEDPFQALFAFVEALQAEAGGTPS